MRKFSPKNWPVIFCASFVLISTANARDKQPGTEKDNTEEIAKLKNESEVNSKVMEIAFRLSDANGPRLTASPGFMKAAIWAKNELSSYGLSNARIEPWGEFGKGWQNEKCYLAMSEPYYAPLNAFPKEWTGSTTGKKMLTSEVVLVDAADTSSFIEKYKGKLAGKIVMFASNETTKPSFKPDASRFTDAELEKMAAAELTEPGSRLRTDSNFAKRRQAYLQLRKMNDLLVAEAPALILSNSRATEGTIVVQGSGFGTYYTGSKELPANVVISTDDYLRIQRLIRAGIPVKLEADIKTKFFTNDSQGYNVIAEIPGTDPVLKDEVVMIGAHLDSWTASTGATDNAAGCAIMMEAIRLLKTTGFQPRRTIRIVLWSGEEEGTLGSKAWVSTHLADPTKMDLLPEHEKLSAYFNLDNGSGRIRGIYCQGNLGVMPIFQEWLNNFNDPLAKTVTISNTGSTDHVSFDNVGIPAFQFIQDELEYTTRTHHTNLDNYDHLVEEDLKQAATLISVFVYNTAQRDEKLPRKNLPKAKPGAGR